MADFTPNRLPDYNDGSLIEELRRVARIVGKPVLTIDEFRKHAKVSPDTLRRRFGTWQECLDRADLGNLYSGRSVTQKMREQCGRELTKNEMLKEIRSVAERLGQDSLSAEDFDQESSTMSVSTLRTKFGSWPEALKQAGMPQRKQGKRYSEEECFENMLLVWTHYGRQPQYAEMNSPPSTVGGKAYTVKWGTWMKAVHAFCAYATSDNKQSSEPELSLPVVAKTGCKSERKLDDADQHKIKLGLRYKILKRDDFKCVVCGRAPATTPGLALHVDHINPFSKGGKTVESNLRTTCSDCNLGKGASV